MGYKLYASAFAVPGTMVSQYLNGPYHEVINVETFGDIRRVWLADTNSDVLPYIDVPVTENLWMAHSAS